MKNSIWKSLKKWLQMGALAGGLMIPLTAEGNQDMIAVNDRINEERGHEITIGHHSLATEGYGAGDDTYTKPPIWNWGPKITTKIDGYELESDLRPTNSVSSFNTKLSVFIDDGSDINYTNRLQVKCFDNVTYKGFDTNRHYVGEYSVNSNYTGNRQEFRERKNLRDLCPVVNTYYFWDGPMLDILGSETNSQGIVDSGEFNVSVDWNRLVSTKTGNGANGFEGNQIMPYNNDTNVTLTADAGNYIDYYVVTRTDNIGNTTTITNDIAGTSTTSTNVPINGIKGSNSIHAVYAPNIYTFDVQSTYGTPTGSGTYNHGSSATSTVERVVDVAPGERRRVTGYTLEDL